MQLITSIYTSMVTSLSPYLLVDLFCDSTPKLLFIVGTVKRDYLHIIVCEWTPLHAH